jgi:hypothetical protein
MTTFSPMQRIADATTEWHGRGLMKRSYELRSETHSFATLEWQSALGSLAHARTLDGAWTLKRTGFFRPRVTVRAMDKETDLAVFQPGWLGDGHVDFPNGKQWSWKCLGFWRARYGFVSDDGTPLIEYHANTFKMPPSAGVVVAQSALGLAELPLLMVLGWYVTILAFDDMTVAGAGAAAAGGS